MRLSVLGPLSVRGTEGEIRLGSQKQRSILAFLAMHAGETVTSDQILEAVWGEELPSSGKSTLAYHLSKLRRELRKGGGDPSLLATVPGGYSLQVDGSDLDSLAFDMLHAEAVAAEKSDPARAAALSREALNLWAGPEPYSDLRYEAFLQREIQRLVDEKIKATKILLQGRLLSGSADEVVAAVPALLEQHPYDEALHGLLMEALTALGRRTEAIRHYDGYVQTLAEETGNTPQAGLQNLSVELIADEEPRAILRGSNLPASITPLIGRQAELDGLKNLVHEHRYIDVVGPGGIGKSRLAAEAVRHLVVDDDSVGWFIDLSRAHDSVIGAVADSVGVKDRPGEHLQDVVCDAVGTTTAMFLFDNCEAFAEEVSAVARDVLQRCPNSRVVTTSRVVTDELASAMFRVAPMRSSSVSDDAPRLFMTRAAAVGALLDNGHATTTMDIVSRLDGIPLAIELAASQLATRSIDDLHGSLIEGGIRALDESLAGSGDGPLWDMLGASVQLLDTGDEHHLRFISSFSGAFTANDAGELVGLPTQRAAALLQRLSQRSLVVAQPQLTPTRYRMLETVREYLADANAREGIADHVAGNHVDWCELVTRTGRGRLLDDNQALTYISDRLANLRAAIDRLEQQEDADRLVRLVARLDLYWVISGRAAEGLRHIERAFEIGGMNPSAEAVANSSAALLASIDRRYDQAEAWFDRALELGEHAPQVVPLVFANRARSRTALAFSGGAQHKSGLLDLARGDFNAALGFFDATDMTAGLVTTLPFAGWHAILSGDPRLAEAHLERTITLGAEYGFGWPVAVAQSIRGLLRLSESQPSEAIQDLTDAETGFETWGDRYSMQITESLRAAARLQLDEADQAISAIFHALSIMETQGSREWEAMTGGIALLVLQQIDDQSAARASCAHWLDGQHDGWRELLATVGLRAADEAPVGDRVAKTASQIARECRLALETALS